MSDERRKVVFIASSPRSGSTLLESMLCAHSDCVGIGEAFHLVNPKNRLIEDLRGERCACGELVEECAFWSGTIEQLRDRRDLEPTDKYRLILSRFKDFFGPDKVLIDSSKMLPSLALIHEIPEVDLRVIHLIRDVRAWTVSMQDGYRRNPEYGLTNLIRRRGWKGLFRYFMHNRLYAFHDWYWTQRKIDKFVRAEKVPAFRIGYEELCFDPEASIKDISDFLGLGFEESMLSLEATHSHNVFGNRMRFQPGKQKRITYDHRWFYKNDWMLPALMFPYIMSYNKASVYSRQGKLVWEQ